MECRDLYECGTKELLAKKDELQTILAIIATTNALDEIRQRALAIDREIEFRLGDGIESSFGRL